MIYFFTFALLIFAGVMNGSFVIPAQYVRTMSNERVWLYHSIIGMIIIPWVIMYAVSSSFFINYQNIPTSIYGLIIGGGLLFGLGQLCFATAIKRIGISLSFPINIGIGIGIGSLFVIIRRHLISSSGGIIVCLAVVVMITALYIFYRFRTEIDTPGLSKKDYKTGWILDCLAGTASGLQNIVFILASGYGKHPDALAKLYWVWPIFLTAAAIPMLIGFHALSKRNQQNTRPRSIITRAKNLLMITLMGIGFTGSLVFYSFGMEHLNHDQQIIGWPLFMVAIILTCQLWGWRLKEFKQINKKYKRYNIYGILFLISAIMMLAFSGLR
jgi:L-rhamnose-H+ transport protein